MGIVAYMLELYQDDLCDLLRPADAPRKCSPEVRQPFRPLKQAKLVVKQDAKGHACHLDTFH